MAHRLAPLFRRCPEHLTKKIKERTEEEEEDEDVDEKNSDDDSDAENTEVSVKPLIEDLEDNHCMNCGKYYSQGVRWFAKNYGRKRHFLLDKLCKDCDQELEPLVNNKGEPKSDNAIDSLRSKQNESAKRLGISYQPFADMDYDNLMWTNKDWPMYHRGGGSTPVNEDGEKKKTPMKESSGKRKHEDTGFCKNFLQFL